MEFVIKHIEKKFKKKLVVKDVNLTLHEGVYGLLGANGSGKTTLMKMMVGTLPSDQGVIQMDGIDAQKQYDVYASMIGYMPQHFGYYPHYTVKDFLEYMSIVKNMPKAYSKQRIQTLLEILNLKDKEKSKMKSLSGGMLRRVGIAQALLNEPKILVLDEPTAGLDPKERIIFRNLIASLARTTIILLSTHIVSDIETIADEILVMKEGEIILQDTVDELLKVMQGKVYNLTLPNKEAKEIMRTNIIVKSHHVGNEIIMRIVSDEKPHALAQGIEPDLDDLYIHYFKEGEVL